jgi:hypothetical protein
MITTRCRNGVIALLAAGMLAAGCGSASSTSHAGSAADVPAMSLNTSQASAAGAWATVVMGGSTAQDNDFWQLFVRPAGTAAWQLVTPPGTADNGGLVVAASGGPMAVTAFRPSQDLTFTPLSQTSNAGKAWTALDPLNTALASTPGSLAVQPGSSRLLALTARGAADDAAPGAGSWTTLATVRSLAATPAGQRCMVRSLTAVAYTLPGLPMLAGACAHPGTAGIFAEHDGTWRLAGPALPASLAAQDISVLRLGTTGGQTIALLQAGSGRTGRLVAAWSSGTGSWTVSAPFSLGGAGLASASFGPAGEVAVLTTEDAADAINGAGASWRALPAVPPHTTTLAPEAGEQTDALAADGSTMTVWHLAPGGTAWTQVQVISVPIQYGSSG